METLTFWVDEEQAGNRLDKFLAQVLITEHSRERLQALIKDTKATVEGKSIHKPSHILKEGETVSLTIPELEPIALEAENIPLTVVFEDEHLLVIQKPTGLLTHPTPKELSGTLVNALLHHCKGHLSGINGQNRPGIVHRLDRDTEGLLMVAKTDTAHRHLSEQLKAKTARRDYIAIVQGIFREQEGTVDAPIGRDIKNREKMGITADGRNAVTHWKVLSTIQDKFSLVRLKLETGRTHQIRVHMASIGRPILNDPLYGTGLGNTMKLAEKRGVRGQLLQAISLGFIHPISQESLRFTSEPSATMTDTWEFLGGDWREALE